MFATPGGQCLGGKTWFVKMCLIVEPPKNSKGEPLPCGDCKGDSDCGDCEKCVNGFCEEDPDCEDEPCDGEPCGEPGSSTCCPEGKTCEQGCLYQVEENCHGMPYLITAPCSGVRLSHGSTIKAWQAICDRYHTHCSINDKYGKSYGTHLDCQGGITKVGKSSRYLCVG